MLDRIRSVAIFSQGLLKAGYKRYLHSQHLVQEKRERGYFICVCCGVHSAERIWDARATGRFMLRASTSYAPSSQPSASVHSSHPSFLYGLKVPLNKHYKSEFGLGQPRYIELQADLDPAPRTELDPLQFISFERQ